MGGTAPITTEFELEQQLAELHSDEGTNFGLPIRPMSRVELTALLFALVRPT